MPTVFVTGANRGLGLEFSRQYAADGWSVIATCRDLGDAGDLEALSGDVQIHQLDVADFERVEALAAELDGVAIDVLANNAGVLEPWPTPFGAVDYEGWQRALRINTMAPLKICECFADHVARSAKKKIAAVSSHLGSIGGNTGGGSYVYGSSKAALNAVMKSVSINLASRGICVAVFHPGWARTRMGGPGAAVDPVDSVTGMRKIIASLTPETTGRFYRYDGEELPW